MDKYIRIALLRASRFIVVVWALSIPAAAQARRWARPILLPGLARRRGHGRPPAPRSGARGAPHHTQPQSLDGFAARVKGAARPDACRLQSQGGHPPAWGEGEGQARRDAAAQTGSGQESLPEDLNYISTCVLPFVPLSQQIAPEHARSIGGEKGQMVFLSKKWPLNKDSLVQKYVPVHRRRFPRERRPERPWKTGPQICDWWLQQWLWWKGRAGIISTRSVRPRWGVKIAGTIAGMTSLS